MTVTAVNDAAILSADVRNLTETNSATDISSSGTLTISDVDSPATFVAQAGTAGTYGTFAIDAAGAWTYTAAPPTTSSSPGRPTPTPSRSPRRTAPPLGDDQHHRHQRCGDPVGGRPDLTETNAATDIRPSGTLTISDVDSPATFVAQAGTAGTYGTFAIDAAGAWTYTATPPTTSSSPARPTPTPSRSRAPTAPRPR